MTKRINVIGLFILFSLLSITSSCAYREWCRLTDESNALYRAGDYDHGVTVAKEALDVAEKDAGPNHHFLHKA